MRTFPSLSRLMRRFRKERNGSIMAITGILLPSLAGAALFSLDHMRASNQIAAMQKAADAAALASARQLAFIAVTRTKDDAARNTVLTSIASGLVRSTLDDRLPKALTVAELLDEDRVHVSLTARYGSLFGELGFFGDNPFTVHSTAQSFGGQDVCFIALGSDRIKPGIEMTDSARLDSGTCEIYSSSDKPNSISLNDSARIEARLICSGGGYEGSASNFSSAPATDCTQIDDPLADRPGPPVPAGCDYTNLILDGGSHDMDPGTYCGKTDIRNSADVRMNPGIYIFKNGELHVHDDSKLEGEEVGLYFDDKKAYFKFLDEGSVNLSAPTTGTMAGMLMSARPVCKDGGATVTVTIGSAPHCDSGRKFEITSSNVSALLGTIHLPNDTLTVDTTMPVSDEAAFTIIVVGRMMLEQSPTLVLNTNYDATDVPVPAGFRDAGKTVPRLVN